MRPGPDPLDLPQRFARRAATISLAVYAIASLVMHGLIGEPASLSAASNLVGASGAAAAVVLAARGRTRTSLLTLLLAILLDLSIDLLLTTHTLSPVLPFLPIVVVGVALLLGQRAVLLTGGVFLLIMLVRALTTAPERAAAEHPLLLMSGLAVFAATLLIPSIERMRRDHDRQRTAHTDRLNLLLEQAPDAIIITDDRWCITDMNRAARTLLARAEPSTVREGDSLASLLTDAQGRSVSLEDFRRHPDHLMRARLRGTRHDLLLSAARLQSAEHALAWQFIVRDLAMMLGQDRVAAEADAPVRRPAQGPLLLVDDDEAVRRLLRTSLTRDGWIVHAKTSAEDALAWLDTTSEPPQILLTDIRMPGLSGVDLARAVRVRHPQLPVVFMTGDSGHLLGHLEFEHAPCLAKPFSLDALRGALAQVRTTPV